METWKKTRSVSWKKKRRMTSCLYSKNIAEVACRFTLDTMQVKMMAIEADLPD
jgi:hypothetical protein